VVYQRIHKGRVARHLVSTDSESSSYLSGALDTLATWLSGWGNLNPRCKLSLPSSLSCSSRTTWLLFPGTQSSPPLESLSWFASLLRGNEKPRLTFVAAQLAKGICLKVFCSLQIWRSRGAYQGGLGGGEWNQLSACCVQQATCECSTRGWSWGRSRQEHRNECNPKQQQHWH